MTSAFRLESIILDRDGATNLHRQLYGQLRKLIENRALPSGTALPSTRLLTRDLSIGRNTVIAAYDQLALEGYLKLRKGAPPLVMNLPATISAPKNARTQTGSAISSRGKVMVSHPYHHGKPHVLAFHPGLPDPDNFPFNTWAKLLGRRAKLARHDLFGTYYIKGYPELCEALARYLAASRGMNCKPEQIIVTNGAQSAFDLLARILIDPGDTVWMEEPGYYGAGSAFLSAGARLAALNVSDSGWDLKPPTVVPRLIFVTPSCHHPFGVTMPMEQRLKLISMAEKWNAWIIEDDYDSEYRFQGGAIPALQGISDSNRVVYVGTFTKILFPAMRLGFIVVPEILRENIIGALSATGQFAPLVTQAALADFMNEGYLAKHLRRMRRLYAARRQFFMTTCEEFLSPWMQLRHTDAGIQLVGEFLINHDDMAIAQAAAEQGVNVSPLSIQYRHANPQHGLVMGFAAADEKATQKAIQKLQHVFQNTKPQKRG